MKRMALTALLLAACLGMALAQPTGELDDPCADAALTCTAPKNAKFDITSPNHPLNKGVAINAANCCYERQCTDIDGDGTELCPHGYTTLAATPLVAAVTDATIADDVDLCCKSAADTTWPGGSKADNAFPTAFYAIDPTGVTEGVQQLKLGESNWGFAESTSTVPYVTNSGKYTGMCFKITTNNNCDQANTYNRGECCNPAAKPAYLQFKLPVVQALEDLDTDTATRKYSLTRVRRCRLSYGIASSLPRNLKRVNWTKTGTTATDAQYTTIALNMGPKTETTMCLFTKATNAYNVDCSWEQLCGLKDSTDLDYMGQRYNLGCEARLLGSLDQIVSNTRTSKCVGITYTVLGFDSDSPEAAAGSLGGH